MCEVLIYRVVVYMYSVYNTISLWSTPIYVLMHAQQKGHSYFNHAMVISGAAE